MSQDTVLSLKNQKRNHLHTSPSATNLKQEFCLVSRGIQTENAKMPRVLVYEKKDTLKTSENLYQPATQCEHRHSLKTAGNK